MNEETLKQIERTCLEIRYASTHANIHSLMLCIGSLVTEVRRLRQELRDYGEHDGGCYKQYTETELRRTGWTDEMLANRTCTCGLDAAIGEEPEGDHDDPETGTPAEPRV